MLGSSFERTPFYGHATSPGPALYGQRAEAAQGYKPLASFARGLHGTRRSLNYLAIMLSLLMPWLLFSAVLGLMSFQIHILTPNATYAVLGMCLLPALVCGYAAMEERKASRGADRPPSWMAFIFIVLVLAWLTGLVVGEWNYHKNVQPYDNIHSLSTYVDVNPAQSNGAQLMDAGIVNFAKDVKVDVSKSMGFKNSEMYCVAPITIGSTPLATYDFWAVGKGCCSGYQTDFHCTGYDPRNLGGMRLMKDADRAFYRLAVQQAEASYNIRATHPLFFIVAHDTQGVVEEWRTDAWKVFWWGISFYFVAQAFLVATATVAFSKLAFS